MVHGLFRQHKFHILEATIADTAGIYGPCAGSFGMEVWHESLTDAFNLLCGRKLSFTNYPMWEKESIKDENAPFVGYNRLKSRASALFLRWQRKAGLP